jgi:hypothetical protein
MPTGRRQLFIYWRLRSADVAAAMDSIRTGQRQLEAACVGLLSGLYLRDDVDLAEATLMETYAVDAGLSPHGVSCALQAHIEGEIARVVQPWLRGARHVEVFDAVDV